MQMFQFTSSTKVYFGTNILETAIDRAKEDIKGNILVITTGGALIKHGHLDRLKDSLQCVQKNLKIEIYDLITQNPTLEEIIGAIQFGIVMEANLIIGFGGGSAIDAAKAVALGIPIKADLTCMEEYLLKGKIPSEETLPIIAIPTTAGTGSELSQGAILSSKRYGVKSGIRGENIIPKVAIVDSSFTWTVPEKVTMETGFDVLAHAIESYVSIKSNLFSETLSEKAIELSGRCLRLLKNNLYDHLAREKMSYASMIMGLNLAQVGTCIPHRLQYPIGVHTGTSHGSGLAALYPSWLELEYEVNEKKVERILSLLNIEQDDGHIGGQFRTFQKSLDIDYTLKELGVASNNIHSIIEKVTGNLRNDKAYMDTDTLIQIMETSL